MVYAIGWMTLTPGHRADFLEQLRGYIAASRAEPGVLFFELLESADSPDVVVAIEGYASAEAHEATRRRRTVLPSKPCSRPTSPTEPYR